MRTLPECHGTVRAHVVEANPSLDFQFYVYVTVDDETEVAEAQRFVQASYPNVRSVLVLSGKQTSRAVKRALPGIENLPSGQGTARGKASNIAKMLLGISLAERLRGLPSPPVFRHHMPPPQNSSFASALRHGGPALVLRVRPDLCFCRPLSLVPLLSSRAVHVPWSAPGMAFDQIAAGPPRLMARYSAAFEATLPRDVNARRALYPESALGSHLEAARVPLRQLRGFHASLARGGGKSGRVSFEDPFGKLKLDRGLDVPANATFPAHMCHQAHKGAAGGRRGRHGGQAARRRLSTSP